MEEVLDHGIRSTMHMVTSIVHPPDPDPDQPTGADRNHPGIITMISDPIIKELEIYPDTEQINNPG